MGRRKLKKTTATGVARDENGTLWIRGRARDPGGVQREVGWRKATAQGKKFDDVARAFAELEGHLEAIRNGTTRHLARQWTVREWYEEVLRDDVSEATRQSRMYRSRTWLDVLGDIPIRSVSTEDVVRAWAAVLASGNAIRTVRLERSYLRLPFSAAHRAGLISINPIELVDLSTPKPKRSRDRRLYALTADEVGPALCHFRADENRSGYKGYTVFIITLAATGMRPAELLKARWSWLSDDAPEMFIPAEDEKTGRGRLVMLAPWVRGHLEEHRVRMGGGSSSDEIFPFTRTPIVKRWKDAFDAMGVPASKATNTSVGCLRHAARTTLEGLQVRPRLVNLMLGHGDQDVTDTYSLANIGEFTEAAAGLAEYIRRAALDHASRFGVEMDPSGYAWGTTESESPDSADMTGAYESR